MKDIKENPLKKIFIENKDGKYSPRIQSLQNIDSFFKFLSNKNNSPESKSKIIEEFIMIIKEHRYICEYFSSNENKSIYIFLFEIYNKENSNDIIKKSIINLIKELILNIEVDKKIFEFIFQRMSSIYREEEKIDPKSLTNYLTLLNSIISDTDKKKKPYNYFCCNGEGNFSMCISNQVLSISNCITYFILNFKIDKINNDKNQKIVSNLIKLNFVNGSSFNVDLEYPSSLIVKEIQNSPIKSLPENEWISLIFIISCTVNKMNLFLLINGENNLTPYNLPKPSINYKDKINSIQFFNNFYGEVSSITVLQNKIESTLNSSKEFLGEFKLYKEGLWKRKIINKFMKLLEKTNTKKYNLYLLFMFTPLNKFNDENLIECSCSSILLKYTGNIRLHNYQCYQKKLYLVNAINNVLPLAEMFLIHPQLLNETNLQLFLDIIKNILNGREKNMKGFKKSEFFQILSLFIERYPKSLFNKKTLEFLLEIGKTIFTNNNEKLCSNYFKHILLNEKILSKYSEDLRVEFWNELLKFTQSDKYQASKYINMNKICLILRFYDKNKYTEMCCEKHLSMIKDEFIGNKTIMNPTMPKKLSYLENILTAIINSQEPKNVCSLFLLLTLDLSPCLNLFIIKIFIKAFQKDINTGKWKEQLIMELVNNKYEVIIVNSFVHALPEIKIEILKLMYEIHKRLLLTKIKEQLFIPFQKMIKTCFLPQSMFYHTEDDKNGNKEINKKTNNNEDTFEIDIKKKDSRYSVHKLTSNDKNVKKLENEIIDDENRVKYSSTFTSTQSEPIKKGNSILDRINALNSSIKNNNKTTKPLNADKNESKDNTSKNLQIKPKNNNNGNKSNEITNKDNKQNKENKESKEKENNNGKIDNNNNSKNKKSKGTLIFKDALLKEYKDNLFNLFYLWALGLNLEDDIKKINNKNIIKSPIIMELLFAYIKELNDINYTLLFLEKIQLCISNQQNAYIIFSNKAIYSSFLDIVFDFYQTKDKKLAKYYDKSKSILLDIFANSVSYMEKSHSINPCSDIDIILIWGHGAFERTKDKIIIFKFLNEFLFECLAMFKIKFEPKMEFNIKSQNFDIKNNFYLKNYFILMTNLFEFCYIFKHEVDNCAIDQFSKNINSELNKYLSTMRFNDVNDSKGGINNRWLDYPFFEEIYKRFSGFWSVTSMLQKIFKSSKKGNNLLRYEEILNQSILDKDNKNIFLKELELLCFEESINIENKKGKNDNIKIDVIIAPIDLIAISIMCILSVIEKKDDKELKDLKYWLKEFKYFIRFLIIASSSVGKNNQNEAIQEKVMCILSSCICFLNDLVNKLKENKSSLIEKAEKTLKNILLFCLIVTKSQYEYALENKNKLHILKILNKNQNQNDLSSCAVFLLFSGYIKDKTNTPIFTQQKIDHLSMSQYVTVVEYFNKPEMVDAFYENQNLKQKIDTKFYFFSKFTKFIEERNEIARKNMEDCQYKFKDEILTLLPLYEIELMKHSNNSLEKNIKYKNIYKTFKKQSFSWQGFWSDRKLYFDNVGKLKVKLVNHITKSLMKPIITPIIDISYYLPEFSAFDPKNLFNKPKKDGKDKNTFLLSMDIDNILKSNKKESLFEQSTNLKENYQRSIYNKSNPELAKSLLKISNHLDFGKEEEFYFIEKEKNSKIDENSKKNKKYYLSCLVKPSHHIKGVFFISEKQIYFKVFLNQKTGNAMSGVEIGFTDKDDDYDTERQTCFGSYFVCHPKNKDLYKISISYDDIKFFLRRRYYYKNSGLEIYTTSNKSFYFNFKYEEEREIAIKEILSKLKDSIKIIDDLKAKIDQFDNVIGYNNSLILKNKKIKKIKISKTIESWKEWEISNFEFIMWLNIYGNRSFNDLSQYPVFPWLITNYEDPIIDEVISEEKKEDNKKTENIKKDITDNINIQERKYRDLSLPMGMLTISEEGEKRKNDFLETYNLLKGDDNIKSYIFGCNYSNPTYVCNYMIRIFPYTHISVELQGDKFDDPNRLFTSINTSFKSCTSQKSDVREIIPEFFYLPEMFINSNDLNMGIKDDGVKVNNVETPCNNNPYEFTCLMRYILENDSISYTIQNWIDLVFGYKNKGKEAESANNLYTESSYQEDIDLKQIDNIIIFLRYAEFGLIPNQLMSKGCEKKKKKEEILKGKEITNPESKFIKNECQNLKAENPLYEIKNNSNALMVRAFNQGKISILLNDFIFFEKKISQPKFDKNYNEEIINYINLNDSIKHTTINNMSMFYSENSSNNKCIQFFNRGKMLIMGGFYDGKLMIFPVENKKSSEELYPFNEEKPILSVEIDKEENYLFLGNSVGNICIYQIDIDINNWKEIHFKTDQISPISHIYCNNELNLWTSATIDGYINLYSLPLCKLIRCIKVNTKKCSYSFISSSPLPSIIVINDDENNSQIHAYSINGNFLFKQQEYVHMVNPVLIRDIYSFEYLAFIGKDNIIIKKLPYLDTQVNIDCLPGIHSFCITEDNKALFTIDKNGKKIVLIKD